MSILLAVPDKYIRKAIWTLLGGASGITVNTKTVKTMDDFRLFALSLNLNYEVLEVK